MTGDNVLERHRNDFFNNVRHNRTPTRMLDKEVQYDLTETMDYEGTDSGIGGSGELATVTVVEINNSPTTTSTTFEDSSAFNSSSRFSNTTDLSDISTTENEHSSIIRRNSLEKLRELDETNGMLLPSDSPDCVAATLPVAYAFNAALNSAKKIDSDSVDEIKEQSSLVVLNNCVSNDEKLKELSENRDESNCALDCLSFTLQCCECTIL